MDFVDRVKKADQLQNMVNEAFYVAENENSSRGMTYQTLQKFRSDIAKEFGGQCPQKIESGFEIAIGMLNPSKLDATKTIKNGISTLLLGGGGLGLLAGIIYIIAYGLTATTVTGILWWKATTATMLLGGPAGIAVGIVSMASGIFLLAKQSNPEKRSKTAYKIIKASLRDWIKEKAKSEFDFSWLKKLSSEEYSSLVSLTYYLSELDDMVTPEEAQFIGCILDARKPDEQISYEEEDIEKYMDVIAGSGFAKLCIDLLVTLARVDGDYDFDEVKMVEELKAKHSEFLEHGYDSSFGRGVPSDKASFINTLRSYIHEKVQLFSPQQAGPA